MIVIHTTGGTTRSGISTVMNPASQVSYHFIISPEGEITQLVDIEHWAYANGTSVNSDNRLYVGNSPLEVVRERRVNANWYTVAVAFGDMVDGHATHAQIAAAVWLVNHIRDEVYRIYGTVMTLDRDHIVGHNQVMPRTSCPGEHFPFERLIRLANRRPAPEPEPEPEPDDPPEEEEPLEDDDDSEPEETAHQEP
jgi:N-acetyl-anhydromuramyl-L-alanine amidase AmpD